MGMALQTNEVILLGSIYYLNAINRQRSKEPSGVLWEEAVYWDRAPPLLQKNGRGFFSVNHQSEHSRNPWTYPSCMPVF